jgi:large subunit ribosomal protein L25
MEMKTLQAAARTLRGRKTYKLRVEEQIPAVVYGAGIEPKSVQLDRAAFTKLYKTAGESTLIELQIEGDKPVNVLIQDIQYDPLRSEVIHADFRAVDMSKKIEADVKLHFFGDAPAVKALGGTMVHTMETVRVRALPKDLVSQLDVDVSSLATFEDAVQVKDITVPEGMEILANENQTLAIVEAPRSEEELAALDKAVEMDVTAVEKVEAKKKEDEEAAAGAEGAAPADAKAGKAGAAQKPEAKKEEKK